MPRSQRPTDRRRPARQSLQIRVIEYSSQVGRRRIRPFELALVLIAVCVGLLPLGVAWAAEPGDCGTQSWIAGTLPSERSRAVGDAASVTNGVVARDGTDWDDASALVLEAGGSITFDLGQPRAVSALFLQADANDRYPVSGSLVGTPGSFEPIAEFADASNRGHGLQPRTLNIAPVSVRFVRIGGSGGDGFYSISEFSIHCRAPEPFPPVLAAAADASSGIQRPKPEPDTAASNSYGRTALLVLAGVLALAGSRVLFTTRKQRKKKRRPRGTEAEAATHQRLRLLFLASGCAALIYEVVWLHLLRLVIGASALSVGIVLSSFMGGMFLGSLWFSRLVTRGQAPAARVRLARARHRGLWPADAAALACGALGVRRAGRLRDGRHRAPRADRGRVVAAADRADGRDAAGNRAPLRAGPARSVSSSLRSIPPTPSARCSAACCPRFICSRCGTSGSRPSPRSR